SWSLTWRESCLRGNGDEGARPTRAPPRGRSGPRKRRSCGYWPPGSRRPPSTSCRASSISRSPGAPRRRPAALPDRRPPVEPSQLVFGPLEPRLLRLAQPPPGPVDVEAEHRHGRRVGARFAAAAVVGRPFQRRRDGAGTALLEDGPLQVQRVAAVGHLRRPVPLPGGPVPRPSVPGICVLAGPPDLGQAKPLPGRLTGRRLRP